MTILALAFTLLAQALGASQDCGLAANRALIKKTDALVEYRVPLHIQTPEMAYGAGRWECARLEFHIDKEGRAVDLSLKENTGQLLMNMAAARALQGYRFRSPADGHAHVYSLIFKGIVGAAPPHS